MNNYYKIVLIKPGGITNVGRNNALKYRANPSLNQNNMNMLWIWTGNKGYLSHYSEIGNKFVITLISTSRKKTQKLYAAKY